MPSHMIDEAVEKLARAAEKARPGTISEIASDFFADKSTNSPTGRDIAKYIRDGLSAEELVDLWNVLFPEDHGVYYNEETNSIHYNEEVVGSVD